MKLWILDFGFWIFWFPASRGECHLAPESLDGYGARVSRIGSQSPAGNQIDKQISRVNDDG